MSDSEYSSDDSLTNELDKVGLPTLPSLPRFDISRIQDFSKEVSATIQKYIEKDDPSISSQLIYNIKTSIASRIQMSNVLYDLNLGVSLSTAIDRLQPLTDIIHETVFLPADDESDEDVGEKETEPIGVDKIINRDRPFVNEVVRPQVRARGRSKSKPLLSVTSDVDSGMMTSDWDNVDELTADQIHQLTDLSKDEYQSEEVLRKKIQQIVKMDLSQRAKNKLVTRLMMGNYSRHQTVPAIQPAPPTECHNDDDEVILEDEDCVPCYHSDGVLGCPHYQRNCKLECPQCHKWYVCRFCHDNEVSDHKLERNQVKHILCMFCGTPQEPETNECVECDQELAQYFCRKCVLYDNDPVKDIYHCDKCGICRLGLGLGMDYFHCDTCNICLSVELKSKHKCLTDTTHSNCPICSEYLFTSVKKVVFMSCGHSIHQHCYDDMIKHSYKCPICKKTVQNCDTQFRILDQEISSQPMPPPYDQWRCIISCNDCKGKSNVQYHVLGLRCNYCKSFNTNQLRLIKPEDEEDAVDETTGFDEGVIKRVRENIGTNFVIGDGFPESDDDDEQDDEREEPVSLRTMFQNFITAAANAATNDGMVGGL